MASPKTTASDTLPARALGPTAGPRPSIARFTCSESRSENMTSWPAFTHRPPIVEPILPDPITPILMGFCAWPRAGQTGSAAAATAANAEKKLRRFMALSFDFRLSQLKLNHGLAPQSAPRRAERSFHSCCIAPGKKSNPHEKHSYFRRADSGHRPGHLADLRRRRRRRGACAAARSSEAFEWKSNRFLADVRLERNGGRRSHRPAAPARAAVHRDQGMDPGQERRHPADGAVLPAPARRAHGPDAGAQPRR